MIEVRELRAPKDVRDTEDRAAERATLFLKARLKRLSDVKAAAVEKKLDKWYTAWDKQTKEQRKRLTRYADLLEGVVEDTNIPFEGSSNVTLHYAAGMTRTFRASFNKTAYQDEDMFFALPSPALAAKLNATPEMLQQLDEGFNYSFTRGCNGLATLKEGTVPVVRDGTLAVSARWWREVRRCFDQRVYRTLAAFQKDYPDAEAAGGDATAYQEILDFFLANETPAPAEGAAPGAPPPQGMPPAPMGGPGAPAQPAGGAPPAGPAPQAPELPDPPELVVGFEYDHVYKNEPEYRIGPWAKFVRYPLFARNLGECQVYGYEVTESKDSVKGKAKRGEYYERGVKKAVGARAAQAEPGGDSWDSAMGFVEGITPATEPADQPMRYVEGCVLLDLDDDGVLEKYQFKYAPKEKALLALAPHRLRRGLDATVLFRLVKRENRLDGVSLIGDCEDLFNQIDFNVRHRNNVRILTTSPVFLANSKYKDQIDLGRAENVIRPGVTYWVDDPDKAIKQMQLQDLSTTQDNADELALYKQHVELVFGPTQGLSGMQTPQDKRAPGNKTIALLTQANGRVDDYLDQFMEAAPELAEVHAAMLFQHAEGPTISYTKGTKLIAFPLDLLGDPGLSWGVKRRSVQLTPEFALARLGGLQQLWLAIKPSVATGDPIAVELWNRQVLASGEPQADKFLLSGQNMQKVQQALAAQMQQQPNNPDAKAQAAGKTAFHKAVGTEMGKRVTGQAPAGRV